MKKSICLALFFALFSVFTLTIARPTATNSLSAEIQKDADVRQCELVLSDLEAHNHCITVSVGYSSTETKQQKEAIVLEDISASDITITPAIKFYFTQYRNCIDIHADFVPGQCYTLRLNAGLTARGKAVVAVAKKELITAWIAPDLSPDLSLGSRGVILPMGTPYWELPVRHLNIHQSTIYSTVSRVYPNTLLNVISGTRTGYRDRWCQEISCKPVHLSVLPDNKEGNSALDLTKAGIPKDKPGIYLLQLSTDQYYMGNTSIERLIVISDMAIFATAEDGKYHINVRSLQAPENGIPSADISLYSYKHQLLAHAITDSDGAATLTPVHATDRNDYASVIIARNPANGDTAYLSTSELFTCPVRSRSISAGLFTERDVIKPGDTMTITGIVRNRITGQAMAHLPLQLLYYSYDRALLKTEQVTTSSCGILQGKITMDRSCNLEKYAVELRIPGENGALLSDASFSVSNFTPDQLECSLKVAASPSEARCTVSGQAKYYFGTPVVDGLVKLVVYGEPGEVLYDTHPLALAGYRFGAPASHEILFSNGYKKLRTNQEGAFSLEVDYSDGDFLKAMPASPLVIHAEASLQGEEGTRPVSANAIGVRHFVKQYVGIKEADEQSGTDGHDFLLKAIDCRRNEIPVAALPPLTYTLQEIRWSYVTKDDGGGVYRNIWEQQLQPVSHGPLKILEGGRISLSLQHSGNYRLTLFDNTGRQLQCLLDFWHQSGESASRSPNPHTIDFTLDASEYLPGDHANLSFESPFAGIAVITCGAQGIPTYTHTEKIREGKNTIQVRIPGMLTTGSYHIHVATASGISPEGFSSADPQFNAGDAVLRVRQERHRLAVTIEGDDTSRGGNEGKYTISLTDDLGHPVAGEVVLWGVDEGLLSLTGFKTPDIFSDFYGDKPSPFASATSYPSLYPLLRVVNGNIGGGMARKALREMHGRHQQEYRAPNVVQLGVIRINDLGSATIQFRFPPFNGRFRLMALASSADAVGSAEKAITLRDPVTLSIVAPAFLAPGDTTTLSAALFNHDFETKKSTFAYRWTGSAAALLPSRDSTGKIKIAHGKSHSLSLPLTIPADFPEGLLKLTLTVTDADSKTYSCNESIVIRQSAHSIAVSETTLLQPGQETTVVLKGDSQNERIEAGSPMQLLQQHLTWLNDYPYGCLEQTLSCVMPYLAVPDLIALGMVPADWLQVAQSKFQNALLHISSMSRADGYSMWPQGDSTWYEATHYAWLIQAWAIQVYPTLKLTESKSWIAENLKRYINDRKRGTHLDRAFALYVLSNYDPRKIRAYAQLLLSEEGDSSPMSQFLIAAALLEGHFAADGNQLWQKIAETDFTMPSKRNDSASDHTSLLLHSPNRNLALGLHLLQRLPFPKREEAIRRLSGRLFATIGNGAAPALSTQEHAWIAMALSGLLARQCWQTDANPVDSIFRGEVQIDGQAPVEITHENQPYTSEKAGAYRLRNTGTVPMTVRHDSRRTITKKDQSTSTGLTVIREYVNDAGKAVTACALGDILTVTIRIQSAAPCENVVVCDLLPANFEIEDEQFLTRQQMRRSDSRSGSFCCKNLEKRFDRALWFGSLPAHTEYIFSYRIRAIATGKSAIPPCQIEAMYAPALNSLFIPAEEHFTVTK